MLYGVLSISNNNNVSDIITESATLYNKIKNNNPNSKRIETKLAQLRGSINRTSIRLKQMRNFQGISEKELTDDTKFLLSTMNGHVSDEIHSQNINLIRDNIQNYIQQSHTILLRCQRMIELYETILENNHIMGLIEQNFLRLEKEIDSSFKNTNGLKFNGVKFGFSHEYMQHEIQIEKNKIELRAETAKTSEIAQLKDEHKQEVEKKDMQIAELNEKIQEYELKLVEKDKRHEQELKQMQEQLINEKETQIQLMVAQAEERCVIDHANVAGNWLDDLE